MTFCKDCGKRIKRQYERCFDCHQRFIEVQSWLDYRNKPEAEKEKELEDYYSRECVMCGKEGASPHKDGQNYCGTCWAIWNS